MGFALYIEELILIVLLYKNRSIALEINVTYTKRKILGYNRMFLQERIAKWNCILISYI